VGAAAMKHWQWRSYLTREEAGELAELEEMLRWLKDRVAVHTLARAKIVNRAVQRARADDAKRRAA